MATRVKTVIGDACGDRGKAMVAHVSAGEVAPEAVEVYRGRRNRLFYLPPGTGGNDLGMPVNVKAFRVPPFPNGYVYRTFRHSKARRSFDNAMELRRLGFGTPLPLAYSEVHCGPWPGAWIKMTHSYYFCEQLPYPNIRNCETRDDSLELTRALGCEMARLHRAGVWFHDFSPGNILVNRTAGGEYEFFYVDLNRMEFGVTDEKLLMLNFKSISWDIPWIGRLAREYAVAAGLDPETTSTEAMAIAREWQQKHERKEHFKHMIGK